MDAIQYVRSVRTRVELNFAMAASFRRLAAGSSREERNAALVIGEGALPIFHPPHAGENSEAALNTPQITTTATAEHFARQSAASIHAEPLQALQAHARVNRTRLLMEA